MEFWNDFEGKTVAEKYRLDHLIGPKGRSAFFTTTNGTGVPSVIRLIESLNDEDQILARWNIVSTLQQEHLIKLKACGQTILDGTHLVYAVLESTDAELADILKERPLTAEETKQVALSVIEGLQTLHTKGFAHEHIKPSNIFAIGETVKLRSDCVRELPEGDEGDALRYRDVHDLSITLLECLTQNRNFEPASTTRLPAPFGEIVRNGVSGAWGLQQITAMLQPSAEKPKPAVAPAPSVAPSSASPGVTPAPTAARPAPAPPAQRTLPLTPVEPSPARTVSERLADPSNTAGGRAPISDRSMGFFEPRHIRLAIAAVLGIILLGWLGMHLTHSSDKPSTRTTSKVSSTPAQPQPAIQNAPQRRSAKPSAIVNAASRTTVAAATPSRSQVAATPSRTQVEAPASGQGHWRVIAFTYNHQDQAQQKAESLTAKFPDMQPSVFSPKGSAPYLVALGGWMTVDEANALKEKARSAGVAHDTYTQNFGGR